MMIMVVVMTAAVGTMVEESKCSITKVLMK